MKNTTSDLKSYQNAADAATLHRQLNEKVVPIPMDWILMDWVYVYGPAGGINSNVFDMSKWIQLHMNNGKLGDKQLVSKENMEFMHSPKTIIGKTEPSPLQHYCIAWVYREYHPNPIIWHTGGTSGCTTMAAFIPNENIGIIILTNSVNKLPERLAYYFFDRYFDRPVTDWFAIFLEQEQEKKEKSKIEEPAAPKKPIPSLPLEVYAGEYENNIFGEIIASVEKGHLILTAGPKKMKIKLTHFDGNIFQAESDDFGGDCGFAAFEVNAMREVEVLNMDLFGGNINPLIRVQKNEANNK